MQSLIMNDPLPAHLHVRESHFATTDIEGFGRVMDASDDEIATLKAELTGSAPPSPRADIPNLPNAASVEEIVTDDELKIVARRFYLMYNDLCHYAHGGFLGVL